MVDRTFDPRSRFGRSFSNQTEEQRYMDRMSRQERDNAMRRQSNEDRYRALNLAGQNLQSQGYLASIEAQAIDRRRSLEQQLAQLGYSAQLEEQARERALFELMYGANNFVQIDPLALANNARRMIGYG